MNHEVLKPKVKSTRDHSDKEGTNVKYFKYGQRVSMVCFIVYVWFILIISFIFSFIIFRLIYLSFIVLIITYHFPFWRSYHTYYDTEALKTAPLSMTRSYIDTAMVTPLPCWWQLVDKRMMLWNRNFELLPLRERQKVEGGFWAKPCKEKNLEKIEKRNVISRKHIHIYC